MDHRPADADDAVRASASFAARIRSDELLVGTVIGTADAALAELTAAPFDFVWLDLEHSALSIRAVQELTVAVQATGCACLVRLASPACERLAAILTAASTASSCRASSAPRMSTQSWPGCATRRLGHAASPIGARLVGAVVSVRLRRRHASSTRRAGRSCAAQRATAGSRSRERPTRRSAPAARGRARPARPGFRGRSRQRPRARRRPWRRRTARPPWDRSAHPPMRGSTCPPHQRCRPAPPPPMRRARAPNLAAAGGETMLSAFRAKGQPIDQYSGHAPSRDPVPCSAPPPKRRAG
jgi:hypothetical protein